MKRLIRSLIGGGQQKKCMIIYCLETMVVIESAILS